MPLFKKIYPVLLVITALFSGCMSPERDLARFSVPGPDEEPAYRAKAEEFVRYAQAGEVDKMLAITSALTFASQSDSLHTLYAQQVVPQFEGTVVTWNTQSKGDMDEKNNMGLMFTGTAQGKKKFSFDIGVMKENGKVVGINIRKHH